MRNTMLNLHKTYLNMNTKITAQLKKLVDGTLAPNASPNLDQGERLLSIVGGAYLFYKSIKNLPKHPLLGIQGAAASGLLLYRGATGICPIYQKMGLDTTDPQAINISETITVNAPRAKVYAFWRDLSNLPKFMQHLQS